MPKMVYLHKTGCCAFAHTTWRHLATIAAVAVLWRHNIRKRTLYRGYRIVVRVEAGVLIDSMFRP